MNFGIEGPMITGSWVNPQTGDSFTAVDTFFEDNNLLIKASDGRILRYDQIQNYLQTDNPDAFKKPTSPQKDTTPIPAEVLSEIESGGENDLIIPDDNIYSGGSFNGALQSTDLGNIYSESNQKHPIPDYSIIDRALSKCVPPTPAVKVSWDSFPRREIEMLVDVMNVSVDEIIQYYINNISMKDIKDMFSESVKNYIRQFLDTTETTVTPSNEEIVNDYTTETESKNNKKKKRK